MKKLALLLILITFSCTKDKSHFSQNIDGYWEIKHVKLNNGYEKEYTVNETIDYIEITSDTSGFRKKMKPQFDGTFKTSNNSESFTFKIENDSFNLHYKTPYHSWKETILEVSKDEMKVINESKDVYLYKRYTPIKVE
ncbi:MAG: lipocalin family protein [Flavobacteriaceae bacterium]|nr:lipocalin family protein [Flavobacteriaceae bacterium]